MPTDVVRVWNGRSESYVFFTLLQRFLCRPVVFKCMCQIVMRGKVLRRKHKCCLVKGDGVHGAALPVRQRRTFLRKTAQDPQPWIVRTSRERIGHCGPVSKVFLKIAAILEIIELLRANRYPRSLPLVGVSSERLCFVKCGARRLKILQGDVGIAQPQKGHGQRWIQPQSLVERPRCLDPDERMQVR